MIDGTDQQLMRRLANSPVPPWREPDEIDRVLMGEMARMRHERRMEEIRNLDIEAWVRDLLLLQEVREP